MITDAQGIELIKKYEGLHDGNPQSPGYEPYICPARICTIGWGSTRGFDNRPIDIHHRAISYDEAEELLIRDIKAVERQLAGLVRVPLTQGQINALVSFIYNCGGGNFQSSTLRMKLNRKDYDGAANEFWKWRRGGGRILPGLVKRRKEEEDIFRGKQWLAYRNN